MKRWLIALLMIPVLAFTSESTPERIPSKRIPCERIVTIGGDVTEIAFALGAGDQLIARDSTSIHPQAAQRLPNIGYIRQLNAEGILAMRPTLVLASAQAKPSIVLEQIAAANVKLVTIPADNTLRGIDSKIDAIASALNKTAQGEKLRHSLDQKLARLPTKPLPVRVLFIMNQGGLNALVAGQQTAADAAIGAAGLQNAMQGFNHYQPLSQEGIIASHPDLVMITASTMKSLGTEANLWSLPGLAQTPAAKQRRWLVVDDMALLGFGLQTPDALVALRQKAEQLP